MSSILRSVFVTGALVISSAAPITGWSACDNPAGKFVSVTGTVHVKSGRGGWTPGSLDLALCEGDSIRVAERSRAAVALVNDAVLRIDQNTTMRLVDIRAGEQETSFLDMLRGAFQSFSRSPRFLEVSTPYLNGSVEGTEFLVRVEDGSSSITVFEGVVVAANDQGEVTVQPGESASAAKGQGPQSRTVVNPREQVQWALYYPPIISWSGIAKASPVLEKAANCAANGRTACAFAELDAVPASRRDVGHALLNASLQLSVGRVDAAGRTIDAALQAGSGPAEAYALRAVIGVAQNRNDAALADGQKAAQLAPESVAAKVALSYAQQASLQLEAARDTLRAAVDSRPENALAWARLAELHLSLGDRKDARAAAERAVQLQPTLSRTQNVLGFAALAEIRTAQARAAFEKAVAFDSGDPLPRLGLGLAKIREGKLEEGRADIEAAVALDSNNALLRAYLGKAYFEEKRGPLDAQQFRIAKELGPNDPTAYLYEAIRLQTSNRPVEALEEIEASIERNDNRAVYRSRLLLDQDRAARGTSLARIYSDLGFEQLGIIEATRSLSTDPTNASAHRFLSDVYRSSGRHETARVSELQQAQMLQDININPIQPSLSDTNLNIITQGGPAAAGFNEFTPLFERNRAQANVSGFVGSNNTKGAEVVLSGVYDRLSISAGRFAYETEGFRPNNELKHELYNFFAQVAVTPSINIQAEYQSRDTDHGDLKINFDPRDYSPNAQNKLDTETTRLGATIKLSERARLAMLYNSKDIDSAHNDVRVLGPVPSPPFGAGITTNSIEDFATVAESDQIEGAFYFLGGHVNLTGGASHADVNREDHLDVMLENFPFAPPPQVIPLPSPPFPPGSTTIIQPPPVLIDPKITDSIEQDITNTRGYLYGDFAVQEDLTVTLGVSHDEYEEASYDLSDTNPKFGLVWNATRTLSLRGAYFEALKPVLASNRTLEPTHVAGFNQLFDDLDATRSKRYGLGVDWQASAALAVGAELTERDVRSPATDIGGNAVFEEREEATHRVYAYWTPSVQWAVTAEAVYDEFENAENSVLAASTPDEVKTVSVPIKASYFHPSGFFGTAGVTFVDQKVSRSTVSPLPAGEEDFTVVDVGVGYRLPKRRGIASLSVHNLFDGKFNYQDDSYREFGDEPSVAPYTPERLLMVRVMLSF